MTDMMVGSAVSKISWEHLLARSIQDPSLELRSSLQHWGPVSDVNLGYAYLK